MEKGKVGELNFNSESLIYFFYRWWKQLITIVTAAAIISSVAALMIRDKYKATAILFPATSNSISKSLIGGVNDVLVFGEEEDAEQLLQMLNSDDIRNSICEKYDLARHYRIDPEDPFRRTKLYMEFMNNISFKRTEYMAVEIDVLDESPDTAALIANDICRLLDSTKARMQQDRAKKALEIVEAEFRVKKREVERLQDSLKKINEAGVNDYESMSEVTNEHYTIAVAKGDARAIEKLEQQKAILGKYGAAYISTRENLATQLIHFNNLKQRYDEAKVDVEKSLPASFTVNHAFPAEKKSYPVRWVIVAVATASSLVFGMLALIIFENVQRIRKAAIREKQRIRETIL